MRPTPDDPDAWNAYLAEGNAKQPRKRVAADVLFRDTQGDFLLVRPTYKPGWDLPGGMAEANEAPEDAAVREVKEELGLTVTLLGLLVVDWVPPHGPWDDQLAFIFDGGVLAEGLPLGPHDEEVGDLAFVSCAEVGARVRRRLAHRFEAAVAALSSGSTTYLHDGTPAW
ncbi:NUDIX domain-containing protein [Streptomyces monomycini]|uniref:NUDIX domain-containing protein n=1 Tax=Streptomyces monomycini TaxID=371720 RepID=UPI0004AB2DD2|nr:NUDIX hydrolase [Streptomyces monomycini]